MTLVEFISPILKNPHRDKILAILYFCQRYKQINSLTVEGLKAELKNARIPKHNKINVADVLNKSGHYVDTPGTDATKRLWKLTDSGNDYIRTLLGLPSSDPEIEHDVSTLNALLKSIGDKEIVSYIEESLKCLSVGALRATIVFIWSGAIRAIQERMLNKNNTSLNDALKKHDPKARNVARIDHFSYIKDKVTILGALELGIIDKNEKDILEENLNLRNKCGHPGKYKPGPKKASSFIEDVVSIVFK